MTMVIIGAAAGLGVVVVIAALGVCCFVRRANRNGGGGGLVTLEVSTKPVGIKKADVDVADAVSTTTHTAVEVEVGGVDNEHDETKDSMPEEDFL